MLIVFRLHIRFLSTDSRVMEVRWWFQYPLDCIGKPVAHYSKTWRVCEKWLTASFSAWKLLQEWTVRISVIPTFFFHFPGFYHYLHSSNQWDLRFQIFVHLYMNLDRFYCDPWPLDSQWILHFYWYFPPQSYVVQCETWVRCRGRIKLHFHAIVHSNWIRW